MKLATHCMSRYQKNSSSQFLCPERYTSPCLVDTVNLSPVSATHSSRPCSLTPLSWSPSPPLHHPPPPACCPCSPPHFSLHPHLPLLPSSSHSPSLPPLPPQPPQITGNCHDLDSVAVLCAPYAPPSLPLASPHTPSTISRVFIGTSYCLFAHYPSLL